MTCQVCHQDFPSDARETGQLILAKGQPICSACAARLGIPADPVFLPTPRATTEALPSPPAKAAGGGSWAPLAFGLALLALSGMGWMGWQARAWKQALNDLQSKVAEPPPAPSPSDVRKEALERLQDLERKLEEATRLLASFKDQQSNGAAALTELAATLREEARKARQESAAAKAAVEEAARAMARETDAAVQKALNDRAAKGDTPAAPAGAPANDELAEQYWNGCHDRAQALARDGRYAAACKEYERVPKKFRRADHDRRVSEIRSAFERQALDRLDLAFKAIEPRLSSGDFSYAEGLLTQIASDCDFPSVMEKLTPRLEEVRTLRRSQLQKAETDAAKEKTRVLRNLIQGLTDPDPEAQRRAVESLKGMGGEVLQPMLQALEHPEARVRWGAIMVLGGTGLADGVLPVAKCLRDKNVQVRLAAADMLAEFNDPRAIQPLIDALADGEESVGRQAERSLERITKHVPPEEAKAADYAGAWRVWLESGRKTAVGVK